MYPATVDEWAEPLEGDDAEMALIRPLLAGTNLREARLRQPFPRLHAAQVTARLAFSLRVRVRGTVRLRAWVTSWVRVRNEAPPCGRRASGNTSSRRLH